MLDSLTVRWQVLWQNTLEMSIMECGFGWFFEQEFDANGREVPIPPGVYNLVRLILVYLFPFSFFSSFSFYSCASSREGEIKTQDFAKQGFRL